MACLEQNVTIIKYLQPVTSMVFNKFHHHNVHEILYNQFYIDNELIFLTSSKADQRHTNNTEKQRKHLSPQNRFKHCICNKNTSFMYIEGKLMEPNLFKFTCATHFRNIVDFELCFVCDKLSNVEKPPSRDTRQYFDSGILRSKHSHFKWKNLHRELVLHERHWNERNCLSKFYWIFLKAGEDKQSIVCFMSIIGFVATLSGLFKL